MKLRTYFLVNDNSILLCYYRKHELVIDMWRSGMPFNYWEDLT